MFNFNITGKERETTRIFNRGKAVGLEEGINIGLRRHFEVTSEFNDDEQELLVRFLIRHNMVLCYETEYGGFRVRKNDRINPQKEQRVCVVDPEYMNGEITVAHSKSLVEMELMDMKIEDIKRERK